MQITPDSLATVVGSDAGTYVSSLVSLGVGILLKYVVDLGKRLSAAFNGAPSPVKTLVAVLFGQGAAWVGKATGLVIQGDPGTLDVTLSGLVLAGIAMGWHSAVKAFGVGQPKLAE